MWRHLGNLLHSAFNHFNIILKWDLRIYAALEKNRRYAAPCRSLEVVDHFIDGVCVLALLTRVPVECAEDTVDVADVRVVRVRIDDKRDAAVGVLPVSDFIRETAEVEEFRVLDNEEAFFGRDALVVLDFGVNG